MFSKDSNGYFVAYFFYERYGWNLMWQTMLWHPNGLRMCYQGERIRSDDPTGQWQAVHITEQRTSVCTCNHSVPAFTPIKYQKYFIHMVGLTGMKDCGYKKGYSRYDWGYKSLLDAFEKNYIPILDLNCTLVIFECRDGMCWVIIGNMVLETSHHTS